MVVQNMVCICAWIDWSSCVSCDCVWLLRCNLSIYDFNVTNILSVMKSNELNTMGYDSFVIIMDWVCEIILSPSVLVLFGSCTGQNLTLARWRHVSKNSQASTTVEIILKLLFTPKDTSILMASMLPVIPELSHSEILTPSFHNNGNRSSLIYAYSYAAQSSLACITCQRLLTGTAMDRGRFLCMQTQ